MFCIKGILHNSDLQCTTLVIDTTLFPLEVRVGNSVYTNIESEIDLNLTIPYETLESGDVKFYYDNALVFTFMPSVKVANIDIEFATLTASNTEEIVEINCIDISGEGVKSVEVISEQQMESKKVYKEGLKDGVLLVINTSDENADDGVGMTIQEKQDLLDMMLYKCPQAIGKLTIDSPISEFTFWLGMVGEITLRFNEVCEKYDIDTVGGHLQSYIDRNKIQEDFSTEVGVESNEDIRDFFRKTLCVINNGNSSQVSCAITETLKITTKEI